MYHFQGEFNVSSEINPAIIRHTDSKEDFGRWASEVEKAFGVRLGRGPDESILVYARDFDAILKFGDYLENRFPDNPVKTVV